MVKTSDNRRTQRIPLPFLHQLVYKRPVAILGGLWVLLLLAAAMAGRGLISPGTVDWEQPEFISPGLVGQVQPEPTLDATKVQEYPRAVSALTRVPEAPKSEEMPLWLFGAIALSCAAGSMLISLRLRRQARPRKLIKRAKPAATVPKKRQRPPQKHRQVPPVERQQPSVPARSAFLADPLVTVVPSEESHPLDRSDDSLADMMDMRKRKSLGSLLRKQQ